MMIFLGSYFPLSVILLAQNIDYTEMFSQVCWQECPEDLKYGIQIRNPYFSLSGFGVCLVCVVITLFIIHRAKGKQTIIIKSVKYVPSDLINYSLPYIVAFINLEYHETEKLIGFLIFLSWMFWITYKSGQIIMNPLLIAFGWRLYELSFVYSDDHVIHTRKALSNGIIKLGDRPKHTTIQDIVIIRNQ